jgi:hypothetical protein
MNAGRSASKAGYKGNTTVQGYLLKQKPRIAEKIKSLFVPIQEQLHDVIWRIAFLCADRMFFDVRDFYRPCKRIVKIYGVEQEVDSYEVVPPNELTWEQQMCIDKVYVKTICGNKELWYKLANRDKAIDMFMACYKRLVTEKRDINTMDIDETMDIIRDTRTHIIAPNGKGTDVIEAL